MDYRKDYYQLLEVPVSASKEEIRVAYRRLAKLYHPDKNAGDAIAEEKFKAINEANEILSNDILRQEYDAYQAEQKRWKKVLAENETSDGQIKQANKKSYTRTQTITTETRIYIKGSVRVKYWAAPEQPINSSFDTELDYKINPTEAIVIINEKDIHPSKETPLNFQRAFKESAIFSMPIPQPVRCEITGENGKEYFELSLQDIRIKDIKLEGITKHDHCSYGTLTGVLYAYSPKFTQEEVEETVMECFGETGKVEQKNESGSIYFRKEYYHPDCSTYWGNWILLPKARTYTSAKNSRQKVDIPSSLPASGCGIFAWIIALLTILFISPKLFIFFLLLIGSGLLFYHGSSILSSLTRLLSFAGLAILLFFLAAAVRSIFNSHKTYIPKTEKTASVKTTRSVRQPNPEVDSATATTDTLITHFLKWEDYASQTYEGNISITSTALYNANINHGYLNRNFYSEIGEVYEAMLTYDSSQLQYLYQPFDSIRMANNLDEVSFSQLLVSAIQSLPYFLVVDKGCNDNYVDDFTRNYLANCKTDCCIGYEPFGVRSPVEFLSDLKGDCDTRSLLLYQLFSHYNYDVALLTSSYYKHAMIAVSFAEDVNQQGVYITINDQRYYLWETTARGLNYGEVSSSINNLSYWDISLLHKKIKR